MIYILLLCGKSCSGKDFLKRELLKLGYEGVVTYTTRPPREGEEDGVAYHFVSNEEFVRKLASGFFAESTSYNVATGETWYYGTAKEDLTGDKVIIMNPDGLKAVLKIKGVNPVSFLIEADDNIRWKRLAKRGDDIEEVYRRMNADEQDFYEIENIVDARVFNGGHTSAKTLVSYIDKKYKEICRERHEKEALAYTE